MLGSSPHARGTLDLRHAIVKTQGIIPACAGNTADRLLYANTDGDHPRMRGEHTALQTYGGRLQGSSPHARGTPVAPRCTHPNTGIIPACAGNT